MTRTTKKGRGILDRFLDWFYERAIDRIIAGIAIGCVVLMVLRCVGVY